MGYYKSPEDMFNKREQSFKHQADAHWAMAKAGEGGHHYAKARELYGLAEHNHIMAEQARRSGKSFAQLKGYK